MEFLKKPLKIYEKDMGVIKKEPIYGYVRCETNHLIQLTSRLSSRVEHKNNYRITTVDKINAILINNGVNSLCNL